MKTIWDSVICISKRKYYLLGFYILVIYKSYYKRKNIWKPWSAFEQLKKLINFFQKKHIEKSTAISLALHCTILIVEPIIKFTKWKQDWLAKNINKQVKNLALNTYDISSIFCNKS